MEQALPEGCISHILSLTSPWDACRASAISWEFKSAADSDGVWEKFLPSDYREIIARSVAPVDYSTKKQLYLLLCDSPILLNDGKLSFTLYKRNGKKCYMLQAKELSIACIPESRFSEVAELLFVCWLDIRGRIATRMLTQNTTYAAYLVFKLKQDCYGLDDAVHSLVRSVGERADLTEDKTSAVYLISPSTTAFRRRQRFWHLDRQVPQDNARIPRMRKDGWMEIELGDFYNKEGDGEVEVGLMETTVLNGKGGIVVEGIEFRPKEVV